MPSMLLPEPVCHIFRPVLFVFCSPPTGWKSVDDDEPDLVVVVTVMWRERLIVVLVAEDDPIVLSSGIAIPSMFLPEPACDTVSVVLFVSWSPPSGCKTADDDELPSRDHTIGSIALPEPTPDVVHVRSNEPVADEDVSVVSSSTNFIWSSFLPESEIVLLLAPIVLNLLTGS
jgi:hypothetical protein